MRSCSIKPGQKFGRWTVIERIRDTKRGRPRFKCICACGNFGSPGSSALQRGFSTSCGCRRNEISQVWAKTLNRLYRQKPPGEAAKTKAFCTTKQSARLRSLSFTLTRSQFIELCAKNCSYCGEPPSNLCRAAGGDWKYNGLDRLNSSLGYSLENVVPCCAICNVAKGTMSREEFIVHVRKIINHLTPC